MGIQTSLDAVRDAERLVDSMRLADELAFEASRDGGPRTIRVLRTAIAGADQLVAIAATHALAQVFDKEADLALSALLSDRRQFLREHAAWALGARLPRFDAVGRLIGMVVDGGFAGMLAQRTLEQWSAPIPEAIAIGIETALIGVDETDARYRLVETLGLVRDDIATAPLLRLARDENEAERVRVAAVSALGQRRSDAAARALLDTLAETPGFLGEVARLAMLDLDPAAIMRSGPDEGLTVAQLFLHADIDAGLSQAGSGDNGGIATLLVRLGDALVDTDVPVDSENPANAAPASRATRVLTLSRGSTAQALASVEQISTRLVVIFEKSI